MRHAIEVFSGGMNIFLLYKKYGLINYFPFSFPLSVAKARSCPINPSIKPATQSVKRIASSSLVY
jgi:hypothetical protein